MAPPPQHPWWKARTSTAGGADGDCIAPLVGNWCNSCWTPAPRRCSASGVSTVLNCHTAPWWRGLRPRSERRRAGRHFLQCIVPVLLLLGTTLPCRQASLLLCCHVLRAPDTLVCAIVHHASDAGLKPQAVVEPSHCCYNKQGTQHAAAASASLALSV